MKHSRCWQLYVLLSLCLSGLAGALDAKELKVFAIGNSFAMDATEFLPEIAKSGGQEVKLSVANKGGASFEEHWKALTAYLADPKDPAARIYEGHSLPELLAGEKWDIITIQQYSMLSGDAETYWPFAEKLTQYLRKAQPTAEIIVHQTWAYRKDSKQFGQIGPDRYAADEHDMWEESRAAYRQLAERLNVRLVPVGDAFWFVDSEPDAGFKPGPPPDESSLRYPAVPMQKHSLHRGYCWYGDDTGQEHFLGCDTHHLSPSGKYLAALVWYGVLFSKSPEKITFVPSDVDSKFSSLLRQVAARIVRENERTEALEQRR